MAKSDSLLPIIQAVVQGAVAESVSKEVFERDFGDMKLRLEAQERKLEKQENLSWQVIVGVLVASFLVLIGLVTQVWFFIAGYNERSLESEKQYLQSVQELRKENLDMELRLKQQMEEVKSSNPAPPKKTL